MRADSRPVSEPDLPLGSRVEEARPQAQTPPAKPVDAPREVPPMSGTGEAVSLLPQEAASQLRSRWELIQSGFVDDPRDAVEQAGELVKEALGQLVGVFEEKRQRLNGSGDIPTEDLRLTLRHYRLLLNRLF